MINKISKKIVEYYISKNKIELEKFEIYEYCFELLISTIMNLLIILILSVITGLYIEGIVFSICFMVMRSLAGGYHANTHLRCLITLLVIFSVFVLINKFINALVIFYMSITMLVISLIIPFLAPIDSINKPLTIFEYKRNKVKSILAYIFFVVVNIVLLSFTVTRLYAFAISYPLFVVAIMLILGVLKNRKVIKKHNTNKKY